LGINLRRTRQTTRRSPLKTLQQQTRVNPKKYQFSVGNIVFNRLTFTPYGIAPDPTKINALQNFKPPTNATEVRSFLGLVNYCAKFIPNFSNPLRELTKKDAKFEWGPQQDHAFKKLKQKLGTAPTMAYYNPNADTTIIVDHLDWVPSYYRSSLMDLSDQ